MNLTQTVQFTGCFISLQEMSVCLFVCVCVHISIFKGFGAAGSNFYFWNEVSEENPALTLLWFFNGSHQHRSRSLKVSHMGEC